MKDFFRSMNFARWSILFSLLGTLGLLWFGLWQRSALAEMKEGLDSDASKLTKQIAQLARKHSQLSDSLKGENLKGEEDMQSYIYKVAGTDWKLTISDNGIGKPDVSASATKAGLGTGLIKALTRQLNAVVDIASDTRGTAVTITHATFKSEPLKAA